MGLACLFGHEATDEAFRGTVLMGHCMRCAKPTIRRPGGRAYVLPRKVIEQMDAGSTNPISARRALYLARKKAFFLSRLPRRHQRWASYYDH